MRPTGQLVDIVVYQILILSLRNEGENLNIVNLRPNQSNMRQISLIFFWH